MEATQVSIGRQTDKEEVCIYILFSHHKGLDLAIYDNINGPESNIKNADKNNLKQVLKREDILSDDVCIEGLGTIIFLFFFRNLNDFRSSGLA